MRRVFVATFATFLTCISVWAQQGNVDTHIAVNDQQDDNTYVVIMANENYQFEEKVPFALNDGAVFKRYCEKTLGIPERNIKFVEDGTLNVMKFNLKWLERIMQVKQGSARCIVYYSGHGMPDEATQKAYLLPVDGFSTEPGTGLSTEALYKQLGAMPSKGTLVILDACFSGAKREGGMMKSSRGVAMKARQEPVEGNMVVFSAAQGNETAYPLKDKEHGMFTYYMLQKLQQTGGGISLGELSDYVIKQVSENSLHENDKGQTPSIVSSATGNDWRNWQLTDHAATKYVNFPKVLRSPGQGQPAQPTASATPAVASTSALDMSAGGAFSLAGVTVEMVRIDAATLMMGQPGTYNSFSSFTMNQPVHQVKLNAFAISKTEVTQALWKAIMGNNPSQHQGDELPVDNVTWEDCQMFLNKLNQTCGTHFRMPTEAEWEQAAACSVKYPDSGLSGITNNIDEWCGDWYGRYAQNNQQNPTGPSMGFQRVVRGAANYHLNAQERVTQRGHMKPDKASASVGLRLVHQIQ